MSEILDQLRQYGEAAERAATTRGRPEPYAWMRQRQQSDESIGSVQEREPDSRSGQRSRQIYVAAVAALIVGAVSVGIAALWDSAQQIESADQRTEMSLDDRIDSLERSDRLATLTRSDDAARDLSDEAVVLEAGAIGFVEVGPPWEGLAQAEPWLRDGHCVSTLAVVGCTAVIDRQSGRRQTWATSHSGGFSIISDEGPDQPVLIFGLTPTPTLVATLLPDNAALLEVQSDRVLTGQIPVEQTIALAVPAESTTLNVEVFDDGGDLIWQTVLELRDRPVNGSTADLPAGEGDPGGEPIEPTTRLGVDAIWPEPLDDAGPEAVAQRFASEVLGWGNPPLTVDPEAAADGPTWVTIDGGTAPDVELLVVPFGDRGWGAVQIGEATSISVAERPVGWTQIGIHQIPGAARVVIQIADLSGETQAWEAGLTNYAEPTSIVLHDVDIEQIATVLVLYNDLMGRTLAVHGGQYGTS